MRRLLALVGLAFTIGGCYVGPPRARHCPGGYWIDGHYDRRGRWHPAHWRCPGVVEID